MNVVDVSGNLIKVSWVARTILDSIMIYRPLGSVCEHGEYVYVVGPELLMRPGASSEDARLEYVGRIEKRRKSGGELVREWVYSLSRDKGFYDCVAVDGVVYFVGYRKSSENVDEWVVAASGTDLELVEVGGSNPTRLQGVARRVVSDGEYLYVAGVSRSLGGYEWIIEKRRVSDASLVSSRVLKQAEITSFVDVNEVSIDPVTGHVWVVEYVADGKEVFDRIIVLDRDLDIVGVIEGMGLMPPITFRDREHLRYVGKELTSTVTFDEEGFAYVGGFGYVAKYDGHANKIKKVRYHGSLKKSSYVRGYVYVAGEKLIDGLRRHFISVFDDELNLVDELVLSKEVNAEADSWAGDKMSYDGSNLYFAGSFNNGWVVYSVRYRY